MGKKTSVKKAPLFSEWPGAKSTTGRNPSAPRELHVLLLLNPYSPRPTPPRNSLGKGNKTQRRPPYGRVAPVSPPYYRNSAASPAPSQALTCGYGGRSRCSRSGAAAGHAGCGASRGGGRSGPSARGAHGHPARPRPWRPSRPRHRVCRGSGRRRSRGSPWCSGPGGCRRRPRGRTSQRPAGACPGTFGRSGCPP